MLFRDLNGLTAHLSSVRRCQIRRQHATSNRTRCFSSLLMPRVCKKPSIACRLGVVVPFVFRHRVAPRPTSRRMTRHPPRIQTPCFCRVTDRAGSIAMKV